MEYEDIKKVNQEITTTDIKGKKYAEVNQRILGFRKLFPNGQIETQVESLDNGVCVIKATAKDEQGNVLGTGHAYEKENSTFINKTSYIENCETSAVGRALGMIGIGADTSVASAEEVLNAMKNQNKKTDVDNMKISEIKQKTLMTSFEKNKIDIFKVLELYNVKDIKNITEKQYANIVKNIDKLSEKCGAKDEN